MTSQERVKILLKKEIPDRMGIYEDFWPETLKDYWYAQGYPENKTPESYFDYDIVNCGGWFNSEFFPERKELVEETEEWQTVKNGYGATLKLWKHKSGTPEHLHFEVTTPEKWKLHKESLLETNPNRLGDIEEIKKKLADAKENGKFTVFGNLFLFELMRGIIGDADFLPALLLERDWMHDFCSTYLDFYKRHCEVLFREAGLPDGFWIYEDLGYNKGLFCSPQTLAEMVMPYEKKMVSFLHDYGLPVILHSCGDIRKAIPLIIDSGFDCLQPMEAKAGCDVVEIAREYGRKISYMGNIDVVALSTNDPSKVEAEIIPKLDRLKEMKVPYFFHSDHSIPPNISLKTYQHAVEIFKERCRY